MWKQESKKLSASQNKITKKTNQANTFLKLLRQSHSRSLLTFTCWFEEAPPPLPQCPKLWVDHKEIESTTKKPCYSLWNSGSSQPNSITEIKWAHTIYQALVDSRFICILFILCVSHTTPQRDGNCYHVHFRAAKRPATATQLTSGGIRIPARGWPETSALPCRLSKSIITKYL